MTSEQFTKIRKKLWKSQQAAADDLGLIQATISHYETGRRPVPEIVVRFMQCIESQMKSTP